MWETVVKVFVTVLLAGVGGIALFLLFESAREIIRIIKGY